MPIAALIVPIDEVKRNYIRIEKKKYKIKRHFFLFLFEKFKLDNNGVEKSRMTRLHSATTVIIINKTNCYNCTRRNYAAGTIESIQNV